MYLLTPQILIGNMCYHENGTLLHHSETKSHISHNTLMGKYFLTQIRSSC